MITRELSFYYFLIPILRLINTLINTLESNAGFILEASFFCIPNKRKLIIHIYFNVTGGGLMSLTVTLLMAVRTFVEQVY